MVSKSILFSIAAAASATAVLVPVLAQSSSYVYGVPFYCEAADNSFFANGGFAKWSTKNNVLRFDFSGDPDDKSMVGLRLDQRYHKTSDPIVFTWDTTNTANAHLAAEFIDKTTGDSFGFKFPHIQEDGGNFWEVAGITGFNNNKNNPNSIRFTYAPQTASDDEFAVTPTQRYETVWLYDQTKPSNFLGSEYIANVTEAGIPIQPAYNTKTQYDCSPSRLPKAS